MTTSRSPRAGDSAPHHDSLRSPRRSGVTLFAVPKACAGHNALIQDNAFGSWASLRPRPDVLLFGGEAGIAEAARRHGFTHMPVLSRNEFGTPLLDGIFRDAERAAETTVLAYVNSDIILLDDFMEACLRAAETFESFLLVGRRWDHVQLAPLDFGDPRWREALLAAVDGLAYRHWEAGIDYFAFSPGLCPHFPPFAIGRPAWDNWFVGDTALRDIPLVDASDAVTAIHQHHDYNHVPGGRQSVWRGVEAARNRELWRQGMEQGMGEGLISSAPWALSREGRFTRRGPYTPSFQSDPETANAHYAQECLRQAKYLLAREEFRLAWAKLEETKNYAPRHPEIAALQKLIGKYLPEPA